MRLEHLPEPPLEFGEAPFSNYEIFEPVYGLARFGPYDCTHGRKFSTLTAVAVGPQSQKDAFYALWNNLTKGVERQQYEPDYKDGFASLYRLEECKLTQDHEGYIAIDDFPGQTENKYQSAITYAKGNLQFDILYIIEPEQNIYYLHDLLKRNCINLGVFSQYLERDTLGRSNQGSVLHNIAVAMYAKAGGMPWRVKYPTINNSCTLGLSFHLVRSKDSSQPTRTIIGIAEVLDEYGQHLSMKVSQANILQEAIKQFEREFRSLYVPKDLMESLVKNSLQSTQWPGRTPPQRLIIHKTTPLSLIF